MAEETNRVKGARSSEWPLAVTYGLPLGAFWSALFLFLASQDVYKQPVWMQLISWGGSFTIVYLCIREYRKRFDDPSDMSFGSAVRVGFFQSLIAALLCALFTWVLVSFVYVDYIQNVLDEAYQVTSGILGDSELADSQFEMMEKIYTPTSMALIAVVNGLLSGLVYSLISAAVLRRKKRVDNPFQGIN